MWAFLCNFVYTYWFHLIFTFLNNCYFIIMDLTFNNQFLQFKRCCSSLTLTNILMLLLSHFQCLCWWTVCPEDIISPETQTFLMAWKFGYCVMKYNCYKYLENMSRLSGVSNFWWSRLTFLNNRLLITDSEACLLFELTGLLKLCKILHSGVSWTLIQTTENITF